MFKCPQCKTIANSDRPRTCPVCKYYGDWIQPGKKTTHAQKTGRCPSCLRAYDSGRCACGFWPQSEHLVTERRNQEVALAWTG